MKSGDEEQREAGEIRPDFLTISLEGGMVEFQGTEARIKEFVKRCHDRGIELELVYLSPCG